MYRIEIGETPRETLVYDLATGERATGVVGVEFFEAPSGLKAIVARRCRGVEIALPPSLAGREDRLLGGMISVRAVDLRPGVHLRWA